MVKRKMSTETAYKVLVIGLIVTTLLAFLLADLHPDDFLSEVTTMRWSECKEFAWMQQCLENHPLTGPSVLDQNAFSATKGFVIAFNRKGIDRFKKDVRFECLHVVTPYFDRALYAGANAFVMNLLVCHTPTNESDVVVNLHIDNTIQSWWVGEIFAHQVNVLYISVFKYSKTVPEIANPPPPDEEVFPQENTMVAFRGDAYHRVMGYRTQIQKKRISLVLEQYQVPSWVESLTKTFKFFQRDNMPMV
ncbi:hypothetical protein GUITHDRAFT_108288 [Guillardia theta CCMP2712]|uniref:Fe2OG dioxygenase domain-containing protein n=1 Tax=Guillardia theta (strain CCMP2712) TaxID=905079 RepID=L1JCM3_GUITC|nr:hypothetical protein GUITHDRAFT_108288 [Guillardia theta CCMP2712]EKX45840.1 hypothetical protein GUITHDRAFT_108288 [Guillardia theta CCMP2712]|eukprot:XP_005832820.1 hypothetical protein GUITHDRAFT_108288 [Guillardia theta CCMP2712]